MSRVFRLIPNFADDNSCCCQSFQEKDNLFSEGVNDSSKVSTCSVKRLSTTSGNRVKTVNQNQEKTDLNEENFGSFSINRCQFIISCLLFLVTFIATSRFKANPILMIVICGVIRLVVY